MKYQTDEIQKYTRQQGSALIVTVLILMAVTVIGLLSSRSAMVEQQIATNDKTFKMTWYATDAVCDGLMPELIEQSIESRGFGNNTPPISYGNNNGQNVNVYKSDFYMNESVAVACPSETNRDLDVPSLGQTDIYVNVGKTTRLLPGNSLLMAEGYHGRGKGLAGGGAAQYFVIRGLGQGAVKSRVTITSGWMHII